MKKSDTTFIIGLLFLILAHQEGSTWWGIAAGVACIAYMIITALYAWTERR